MPLLFVTTDDGRGSYGFGLATPLPYATGISSPIPKFHHTRNVFFRTTNTSSESVPICRYRMRFRHLRGLRDEAQFNSSLSSRVVVEHTFEQIKARFPFLTSVSIRISDEESHQKVVQWFYLVLYITICLKDKRMNGLKEMMSVEHMGWRQKFSWIWKKG